MIRPTLHISVLSLFLVIILVSTGALTWMNYKENTQAAVEIADQLLTEVNGKVLERINFMFGATFRLAHQAPELPYLANKPQFMQHDAQWFLAEALLKYPYLYSVYIGYQDGDFYQIISLLTANAALREKLGAKADAQLAVRRVFARPLDGRRIELWQFLDSERRLVGSRIEKTSQFDPRTRPWYKMSIDVEGVTQTPFYAFASTGAMGLTISRRFDGPVPGVFGVDVSLAELSAFFAKQRVGKTGIVFMFDSMGYLTAHPNPDLTFYPRTVMMGQPPSQASLASTHDSLLLSLWRDLEDNGSIMGKRVLDVEGQEYLMHISPVRDKRLGDQYIAVAAPVADFTGSVDRVREQSLLFSLVILCVAIIIAIYMSRLLSRPLKRLALEADEIRQFNLDAPVDVKSSIAEIDDLTKAVKTMKSSLSTFGRYVPKALVRQLLFSKLEPKVGGERREATLLFTDIADFTTISEGMEPEDLMRDMSEYLEAVGGEILYLNGTIDKFIGDAIMAFWNAPTYQENHAELACEAALRARRANDLLNERWSGNGNTNMYTRFGLHTGEGVVGNVGSADRLNYTIIGSTVNLASRLEGLNKYFGTQILASETVRDRAHDKFLFRSVGKVVPKGTSSPITVYELLGGVPGKCDESIAAPAEGLTCVVDWEKAFTAYQERRFDEAARLFNGVSKLVPSDRLTQIMKDRAEQYLADPPGDDWDGVDVFKTK